MTDILSKERILEIEKKLLDSIKECDINNLDDLLHDDLIFHLPNGQVISKGMDLEAYSSGNMIFFSIAATDHHINVIDDIGIVSVIIEMKCMAFNQPVEGKFRYIRVWKSFNNMLKVIAGSCIKM